jgi:serine/threonine-protein kinase
VRFAAALAGASFHAIDARHSPIGRRSGLGIIDMRILGTFVVICLMAGCGSRAFAADTYAAIAYSKETGAYGYGNKYRSRDDAEERALQECGPGCTVVMWVRNQCAGLAVGRGKGYGTYRGENERIVGDAAINQCEGYTSDCELKVTVCSGW